MKKINVLWTGGLDSTCRVVELSCQEIIIQPYYILVERSSRKQEIKAMKEIISLIRKNQNTRAILNDVILVAEKEILENLIIEAAWKRLNQKYMIGSQYMCIAKIAENLDLNLEVGLEYSPRSKAVNALTSEGEFIVKNVEEDVDHFMLDEKKSSKDILTVFGRLQFPTSLWKMSKLEEIDEMKRLGYEEVISHTWFCHTPVLGKPCGHCNPCKDALNEGLAWRVPKYTYYLYYPKRFFQLIGLFLKHPVIHTKKIFHKIFGK